MNPLHDATLDLNLLKLFDAVMETRNVTRAAERLGIGQSAVSHGLARLREVVGDALFVRAGGRMEPTVRAQRLAQPIRDALVMAAGALSRDTETGFDPRARRRVFTLGAGDYAAAVLLGGFLDEVAMQGFDIGIAVLPVDRHTAPRMLDAGEIDLALGLLPRMQRWQERQVLFEETQLCIYDGARMGLGTPLSLEEFLAWPHIVPSLHGEFHSFADEELAERGHRRRSIMATAHFLSIPLLLKRARALSGLPRRLALASAESLGLTVSPLPFPARHFDISMLWHKRDTASSAHRWLRERIVAHNQPAVPDASAR